MISILSNHIQDRRNFASEIQSTPLNLFEKIENGRCLV